MPARARATSPEAVGFRGTKSSARRTPDRCAPRQLPASACQLLDDRERLAHMRFGAKLRRKAMPNDALAIDDEGLAAGHQEGNDVVHVVQTTYGAVGVGQKDEAKAVVLGKGAMPFDRVRAHADHLRA